MVSCGRKTVTDQLKAGDFSSDSSLKKNEQLSSNTFGKFQGKLHTQSQIECTLQMAAPTSLAPRRRSANRKHHCKLNCKAPYLVFEIRKYFQTHSVIYFSSFLWKPRNQSNVSLCLEHEGDPRPFCHAPLPRQQNWAENLGAPALVSESFHYLTIHTGPLLMT